MPLHLSLMREEDIPAFAIVDCAAMASYVLHSLGRLLQDVLTLYAQGLAQAMDLSRTGGEPRQQMVERWTREGFRNDNEITWLKVTDTDTNELVAAALWTFQLNGEKPKMALPAPAAEIATNASEEPKFPPILAVMAEQGKRFKQGFIGSRPYANLSILVTDPKHQRRGAGSMLVQFGCDKADERGIISYLTASQAGLGVYLKHGFEVVQEEPLDLRPYGVNETEIRRRMIRQPKSA